MTHWKSPPFFSLYLSYELFTSRPTMCYVKKLILFFALLLYNSDSPNQPFDLAQCIYITQPTYVCVCLRILTSPIQYMKRLFKMWIRSISYSLNPKQMRARKYFYCFFFYFMNSFKSLQTICIYLFIQFFHSFTST